MTKSGKYAALAAALALAASLPLLASCQSVKSFFGGEEVITYGGDQPENYPVLHAVGYGLINIQKGPTRDEKVLQAMNVSNPGLRRRDRRKLDSRPPHREVGRA